MKLRYAIVGLLSLILIALSSDVYAAGFNFAGVRLNKKVKSMREIRQENVVIQSLDFSCGAAGLATLLNYYLKNPVDEADIINSLLELVPLEKVIARKGFSLLDLKTFAKSKGYQVTGYKMDIEFLKKLNKPVLVPVKFKNYRHFVIVKGVLADRVFIADPAAGNISMKIARFKTVWNNDIGLVIEKAHEKDEAQDYELKVKEEDFLVADYKNIRRLIDQNIIRTIIHTDEWVSR